jgi:hypothetical protein
MSKTIPIMLVNEGVKMEANKKEGEEETAAAGSDSEEPDLMFKVKIEKPDPAGVKISKRNTCIVQILQSCEEGTEAIAQEKLLQYLIDSKEPSWQQQFKNAVMLGPQIDDDDLVVV